MKRLICLLICLLLCAAVLCACGDDDGISKSDTTATDTESVATDESGNVITDTDSDTQGDTTSDATDPSSDDKDWTKNY